MSRERYFREELTFLREQGKEFAEIYPQLTRYLNAPSRDPDVERLLEGFAFLSSRLRAKIDDEFPELTHSILSMLWPNYLRPIPSMTIMQFTPDSSSITQQHTINKGLLLSSRNLNETLSCTFQTCREVTVYPIVKQQVTISRSRNSSHIDIHFKLDCENYHNTSLFEQLRFFLNGDRYSVEMLYLWFNHYISDVELISGSGETLQHHTFPKKCIRPVGFNTEQGLLPYPKNCYEGYRIIQEYLCYEQAFHFIDLFNLARFTLSPEKRHFMLRFHFSRSLPEDVHVNDESFQLYCTPAINLFKHDADPITLSGKQTEYLVTPSSSERSYYEVFSVDEVTGSVAGDQVAQGQPRVYTPFESFQHEIERAKHRQALYYRVKLRESNQESGLEHLLSLVRSDETQLIGNNETISIELTCTNRQLPTLLGIGDIIYSNDKAPSFATFKNITQPTQPLDPVLDGSLLWSLISNLSLNYLSLLSRDAIISILRAYDFRALHDRQIQQTSQQRLNGILKIESTPLDKILAGMPIRGIQSVVTLDPAAFGSEGSLYLFGSVLRHFFSLYASVNSFHELIVINAENKERYKWKIELGSHALS